MDYVKAHQPDMMLFVCGMCGILAVMTLITRSLPRKTRAILACMEISAMLLLFFDRFAYIYKGDASATGYYMVRISNGMVYFLSLLIPFFVTRFLCDVYKNEARLPGAPIHLVIADSLFFGGAALLVYALQSGLYYTFDETNNYHRAPWNAVCYVVPLLIVIFQEWSIFRYGKRINRQLARSMIVSIALPSIASIFQIFAYGLSLINMTTALVVCVFYTYALSFLSEAAERARAHELAFYMETQKKEAAIFEQTTEALANAIDAKDKYTRGHSSRVAAYARQIAREAGLPAQTCDQVYFAALLHDVGKIGVSLDILNKRDKLNEEEFAQIKAHPILGEQILSSIKQAPFLSIGAHYHHERYDGGGYPDGLAGGDIPQIARIIAVADAYDAMTSARSYRAPLTKETVMREFREGMGTQFDPSYTSIMLRLMEEGRIGTDAPAAAPPQENAVTE